ncbi:glucanase B, partial [Aureobasidium melanogenum]
LHIVVRKTIALLVKVVVVYNTTVVGSTHETSGETRDNRVARCVWAGGEGTTVTSKDICCAWLLKCFLANEQLIVRDLSIKDARACLGVERKVSGISAVIVPNFLDIGLVISCKTCSNSITVRWVEDTEVLSVDLNDQPFAGMPDTCCIVPAEFSRLSVIQREFTESKIHLCVRIARVQDRGFDKSWSRVQEEVVVTERILRKVESLAVCFFLCL